MLVRLPMFKPGNRSSQVTTGDGRRYRITASERARNAADSPKGSSRRGGVSRLVLHEETLEESVWMRDVIVTLQEAGGGVGARKDFDLIPSAIL
ncbi:hypothetical protein C8035_v006235 [Colletotrichum spinosum]|uniref:Uncharacterized protein n=1 Tax=Colletotrichum spinosum TaxID=1347390 RepID=A0A4R8QCK0_9PEZI|nr:hypothetical protein C8035_v006235 [Colletotrichum spinosum]